jgi:hypothetical protein
MFLPILAQLAGGVDSNIYLGANRIAGIANVGYSLTSNQRQLLNPLFRYLRGQGLASNLIFHHDPRIGFNNNLCRWTDDITTANIGWAKGANLTANGQVGTSPITGAKAWSFTSLGGGNVFIQGSSINGRFAVLPNTTYTISADVRLTAGTWTNGARSLYLRCQDSGGTVTSNRGNTELALTSNWQRFSITVTTGASDAFASFSFPFDFNAGATIEVAAPQVELGNTATPYQRRLDNTALRLNNTVNNALGDGTLLNGEVGNMTRTDAQAGEVLNYNASLSQGITLADTTYYANYTVLLWIKVNNLASTRVAFIKGLSQGRIVVQTDGAIRVNATTGGTTTATGLVVANTWTHIAVTMTATTTETFTNGASRISGAITRTEESTTPYHLVNSAISPLDGQIGEATLINTVLTPTQILAIYNIQKARYGL